jgi:hypothetical protein
VSDSFPSPSPRERDVALQTSAHHIGGCALLAVALFWNGITWGVGIPLIVLIHPPWFLYAFMSIFALVGVGLLFAVVKKFLAAAKLHRPRITVSMQPLLLGEEFTGRFEQMAKSHANINRVSVKLVCRETATYRAGTNTTTVHKDVLTEEAELPDLERADPITPLQGEFRFRIPDDAMHCFEASNNRIEWLIETHTDVQGWPDYKASFALAVAPGRSRSDEASP